ncbi:Dystrophin [Zootermopsis nevadensis]|uniref:Dystrophin n=1 Tax=Zootermopsis nevadensis TaxID=136037 RepID=A0A067R901_ZOONE|nr:Dystrophin [Zootermopsis nevadensis]
MSELQQTNLEKTLLAWCCQNTKDYPGVDVKNFTTSWSDGLAFNALIHHWRSQLFDFHNSLEVNLMVTMKNSMHNGSCTITQLEENHKLISNKLLKRRTAGLCPTIQTKQGLMPCLRHHKMIFGI